ncbi:hypothetical protein BHE74_00057827 [Ensete ventricosum]|nr:hypothetical protein BHE74_00057827 [Ensete ventricosum]
MPEDVPRASHDCRRPYESWVARAPHELKEPVEEKGTPPSSPSPTTRTSGLNLLINRVSQGLRHSLSSSSAKVARSSEEDRIRSKVVVERSKAELRGGALPAMIGAQDRFSETPRWYGSGGFAGGRGVEGFAGEEGVEDGGSFDVEAYPSCFPEGLTEAGRAS